MWAFETLFMYALRATDDLEIIFDQHPEKRASFWICVTACTYTGIKLRLKTAFRQAIHVVSALLCSSYSDCREISHFGLYRKSSSCARSPGLGGFGINLLESFAFSTAFCSIEWNS